MASPNPPSRSPNCPRCGYSLIALPDAGRCPECGEPYDPVVLAYVVDPVLAKRNRNAWASVFLPVVAAMLFAFTQAVGQPPARLIAIVIIAALVTVPLARTVLALAPFHPSKRLLGASITGLLVMLAAFSMARAPWGGGRGLQPAWQALVIICGILAAPVAASTYVQLGRRMSGPHPRSDHPRDSGDGSPPRRP